MLLPTHFIFIGLSIVNALTPDSGPINDNSNRWGSKPSVFNRPGIGPIFPFRPIISNPGLYDRPVIPVRPSLPLAGPPQSQLLPPAEFQPLPAQPQPPLIEETLTLHFTDPKAQNPTNLPQNLQNDELSPEYIVYDEYSPLYDDQYSYPMDQEFLAPPDPRQTYNQDDAIDYNTGLRDYGQTVDVTDNFYDEDILYDASPIGSEYLTHNNYAAIPRVHDYYMNERNLEDTNSDYFENDEIPDLGDLAGKLLKKDLLYNKFVKFLHNEDISSHHKRRNPKKRPKCRREHLRPKHFKNQEQFYNDNRQQEQSPVYDTFVYYPPDYWQQFNNPTEYINRGFREKNNEMGLPAELMMELQKLNETSKNNTISEKAMKKLKNNKKDSKKKLQSNKSSGEEDKAKGDEEECNLFQSETTTSTEEPKKNETEDGEWRSVKNKKQHKKPVVTVYLEAECCTEFLREQFIPTYHKLKKHIDVEFVPYGKTKENSDGTFECEKGCKNNIALGCMLSRANNTDQKVEVVNCLINPTSNDTKTTECKTMLHSRFPNVTQCVSDSEGTDILKENGKKTKAVIKNLTTLPVITINKEYNEDIQEEAQTNLKKVICKSIKGNIKPCSDTEDKKKYKKH